VSCTLSAAAATCAANPVSVAPGSNTTITVTTTAHQLLPLVTSPRRFAPWLVIPLSLLMVLALTLFLFGARTRRQRLAISVPLVGIVFFLTVQGVGCSGSGSGPSQHGTQVGSYPVTITGTSGSTIHTATVTVVVN
jgi:hypothetical protein